MQTTESAQKSHSSVLQALTWRVERQGDVTWIADAAGRFVLTVPESFADEVVVAHNASLAQCAAATADSSGAPGGTEPGGPAPEPDKLGNVLEALDPSSPAEVAAFEKWAIDGKYDMTTHPLHWLFVNMKTYAARQGWKAALCFARAQVADLAAPAPKVSQHPDCPVIDLYHVALRSIRQCYEEAFGPLDPHLVGNHVDFEIERLIRDAAARTNPADLVDLQGELKAFESEARRSLHTSYDLTRFPGGSVPSSPRMYFDPHTESTWRLWQVRAVLALPVLAGGASIADRAPVINLG